MPHTQSTRDRIIMTASQVFYKQGYRATGVEAIAKAAGITKATLYHHFRDKDALIEESLKFLSRFHRENYVRAWSRKGFTPQKKLTVLFDEMHKAFGEEDFFGCPFINASGEYTEHGCPARIISEMHYQYIVDHLEQFAREARLTKPRHVAESVASLIAGGYTSWMVGGMRDAAKVAKSTAELLISAHAPRKKQKPEETKHEKAPLQRRPARQPAGRRRTG